MIPFALYLAVFSLPPGHPLPCRRLHHGQRRPQIAAYLAGLRPLRLPLYGVNTYLQKTFSSLRRMGVFAGFNFIAGAVQIGLTMFAASHSDVHAYQFHRRCRGAVLLGAGRVSVRISATNPGPIRSALCSARLGYGRVARRCRCRCRRCCDVGLLQTLVSPLSGSIVQALVYVMAGGLVALAVTFVPACKLNVPEAAFINTIVRKIGGKLGR